MPIASKQLIGAKAICCGVDVLMQDVSPGCSCCLCIRRCAEAYGDVTRTNGESIAHSNYQRLGLGLQLGLECNCLLGRIAGQDVSGVS